MDTEGVEWQDSAHQGMQAESVITEATAPAKKHSLPASAKRHARARRPLTARGLACLLFGWSLASSTLYFAMAPDAGMGPGPESLNLARTLAATGAFANPYHALPTGPSAHMAPLYPLLMAAFIRLTNGWDAFSLAIILWNLVAQATMVASLPSLSEYLFGQRKPGIIASVLFIALPLNLLWAQWDAITVACGLTIFCLATRRLAVASRRTDVATGFGAGVLTLLSPTIVVPCVAWCAFVLRSATRPRSIRFVLAGGVAFVLTLTPWTIRNYTVFHSLVPMRDNFGLELYVSNRDGAGPTYMENFTLNPNMPHPNSNVDEARLVRDMGEVAYNRSRQSIALRWISQHPGEFIHLTALRIQRIWFPIREPLPISSYSVWTVTLLSLGGLVLLAIRKSHALWFIVPALGLYPLPYYLTNNDARYRYPILWISALCLGYACVSLADRLRARSTESAAVPR